MHLVVNAEGHRVLSGNNLVFESEMMPINQTGVFHYTVEFSADDKAVTDPSKAWISVNDIAHNRDGVIITSPQKIHECLSIPEVCARKVGATVDTEGNFISGTLSNVTAHLAEMSTPPDRVDLLDFDLVLMQTSRDCPLIE